jgi:hypothetical protein
MRRAALSDWYRAMTLTKPGTVSPSSTTAITITTTSSTKVKPARGLTRGLTATRLTATRLTATRLTATRLTATGS